MSVYLKKKSKCFVRKKKSKCPKENFQSVKRGKMFKYRISGVRKKKVLGEDVWVEFLLSSCSLRLYVNLQVEVTEKKKWKFSKYFAGRGLCLTHVGAPCCETWLKFEVKVLRCREKKG